MNLALSGGYLVIWIVVWVVYYLWIRYTGRNSFMLWALFMLISIAASVGYYLYSDWIWDTYRSLRLGSARFG